MFAKPYKLKSNAVLKGSDAKRLRIRIQESFPNVCLEKLDKLFPNKSSVSVMKIITHSGFVTSVYSVDRRPMFFEIKDGRIAPTIYALWIAPNLLPHYKTYPNVLPILAKGADLMAPGIVLEGPVPFKYGCCKVGQLVAVCLTTNNSAVGVGTMLISSETLFLAPDRGAAVKMLHLFGDTLWGCEPVLALQIPEMAVAQLTESDFPELGAAPGTSSRASGKLTSIVNDSVSVKSSIMSDVSTDENMIEDMEQLNLEENGNAGTSNADTVLRNAFLTALKHHGKDLTLPVLTSNFYRVHIMPEMSTQIDMKKTKYKKLSTFLNEMAEEGFVEVREETKGIDKITKINFEHPQLVNFIADVKTVEDKKVDPFLPLYHAEMMELYLVTDDVVAFFTKLNYKRGEGIPSVQVKKILREYVSKNNLPISNPASRTLKLDECLQQICGRPEASLDTVFSIFLGKMHRTFKMRSTQEAAKNKPAIQMSLANRSGNKKVTLVSNLECYGIIMPEFIKLCKQGAAASTTIVKVSNQNREMLQIQGNQVRFIFNLLTEKYKIPAKQILGLELAKPVKKKK